MTRKIFFYFLLVIILLSDGTGRSSAEAPVKVPASREDITLSFAPVVKRAAPSVVNIYTSRHIQVAPDASPLFNDPFFNQFFAPRLRAYPKEREVQSLGSGVIVDSKGLVVTSLHVVKDASDIRIVLGDRRSFDATVVVADQAADLALLQLKHTDAPLPAIEIVDSDALSVGDLVLAIGNPFGVGQTVTSGIISGLSRSAAGVNEYDYFIQTDAAINPGNSGGALVNMRGELIGINTAIFSKSGGSIGIGFAIPSNMVRALLHNRGKDGSVVRLWLGAEYSEITPEVAKSLGLGRIAGALIENIIAGSPAEKAGLKAGDVITQLDGKPVDSVAALRFRIGTASVDAPVVLSYLRNGSLNHVSVTLTPPPASLPGQVKLLKGKHPLSGVKVGTITPQMASAYHLPARLKAVIVLETPANAPSFLRPGDIITGCNGHKITEAKELERALDAVSDELELQFIRDGHLLQLSLSQ